MRCGPKRRLALPAMLLGAVAVARAAQPPAPAVPEPLLRAAQAITERAARARVRFLASDALAGRDTASPELEIAAHYLASELEAAGLEPAGDRGGFLQAVELERVELDPSSRLERLADASGAATGEGGGAPAGAVARLALDGVRAAVLPGSGTGTVEAPVVFCGYGVQSEELGWDDYAGVDVRGKIVLVLRYEPGEKDPASPFDGERHTRHAFIQTKLAAAARAGAAGLLLVTGPRYHAQADELIAAGGRRLRLAADAASGAAGSQADRRRERRARGLAAAAIPAVHLAREAVATLLAGSGFDLQAAQEAIDTGYAPCSRALPVRLRLEVRQRAQPVRVHNVAGLLRGADPALAGEAVVVGAHYDHVGVGEPGPQGDPADRIYNGADDNASGTAAVLEAARAMAMAPRPRRSVLFVFFAAEEQGLLGSIAYVRRPIVPLDRTVAMINLDMVGRNEPERLAVFGVRQAPALERLLLAANACPEVGFVLERAERPAGGSDHVPFLRAGVPALHLFSGMHADYHRPGDHADKIDAGKVARSARLAMLTAWLAANAEPGELSPPEREPVLY